MLKMLGDTRFGMGPMNQLSKLDSHAIVRALAPGMYMFSVFYVLSEYDLIQLDARVDFSLATLAIATFIGFCIDSLSLYKLHPVYRKIRRTFFLALFSVKNDKATLPEEDKIQLAEHYREDVLYAQDPERKSHLRWEHAIWIVLYNVSIISGGLALLALAWPFFDGKLVTSPLIVTLALLTMSGATSIAAAQRNKSYSEKILYLAGPKHHDERNRTATLPHSRSND